MRFSRYALAAMAAGGASSAATAAVFPFDRLSSNGSANVANQLSLIVSDLGGGNVLMRVANAGPLASTVTQVYFDNDARVLSNLTSIDNSDDNVDGVDFRSQGSGTNFPSKPQGWDTDFSAYARNPRPVHGVDPGESVAFTFSLRSGENYNDFISALNDRTLRVGLHVQALADGQSDSFVTSLVPVPAAAGLAAVGLATVAGLRRRAD